MTATQVIETTPRVNGKGRKAPPKKPTQWIKLLNESDDLMWSLTPELDVLNTFVEINDDTRELFRAVAQRYRKIQSRYLCQIRPHATKVVLDAIVSRTLDFRKFAERITYKQFTSGVVEKGGGNSLLLDEDGVPIFNGLEMSKNTVARCIDRLLRARLIEQFKYMKGTTVVYAYMPFPREFLAANLTAFEWYFDRAEKPGEARATIKLMLAMIEGRWPSAKRPPYLVDFNIQDFYHVKGMPEPILSEKAKAREAKAYGPDVWWLGTQK